MPTPLTIGLLGPAEMSVETAIALLEDAAEQNDPVEFIVAASGKPTPTMQGILDYLVENEVVYTLVTDDTTKVSEEVAEAAAVVQKVARVSKKVVALLGRAEGDRMLAVLWDDEDEDCTSSAVLALDLEIDVRDLSGGLDKIRLAGVEGEVGVATKTPAQAPDDADKDDAPTDDGLDDLGVRALRNMVQEQLGLARKDVGSMDKPQCIAALRGAAKVEVVEGDEDEDEEALQDEADDATEPERHVTDEVEVEDEDEEVRDEDEGLDMTATEPTRAAGRLTAREEDARDRGLDQAIAYYRGRQATVEEVLRAAHRFRTFLLGEQATAGRPRKDGSPAQPRR